MDLRSGCGFTQFACGIGEVISALPVYPGRLDDPDDIGFLEGLGQQVERARVKEFRPLTVVGQARGHDQTGGRGEIFGCLKDLPPGIGLFPLCLAALSV